MQKEAKATVERLRLELANAERDLEAVSNLLGGSGPVLSGDSLREQAHQLLQDMDPRQKGVHYQKITRELIARGFVISGKSLDKAPNVRSTIGYGPKAALMFRAVGKDQGLYTWK